MSLPTLFISHGAPTLALAPGRAGDVLRRLADVLPRPTAALIVSAHWIASSLRVSARDRQVAWHDFRGFPRALHELRYDAPGDPGLTERVARLLGANGQPAALDPERPLDHGAWVPMRLLYPGADIPVVQLSLRADLDAADQMAIGAALEPLRHEGVLMIGSGSFTHNLEEFDPRAHGASVEPYVDEFRAWMIDRLAAGERAVLADWRARAPHARRAHPTDEHLLPLFFAVGGAGSTGVLRLGDEVTYGMLAMDAFAFGATPELTEQIAAALELPGLHPRRTT